MQITPQEQAAMQHRPLSAVRYFIVHHSDAPQTLDITEIAAMEKTSLGAITVAYHAYIRKNPATGKWEIQEGRTSDDVPAAAYGENFDSYDVCIAGQYEPGVANQTPLEEEALDLLLARIEAVKAKFPNLQFLIGHRDVAAMKAKHGLNPGNYSTACPGSILYARLHDLRVKTGLHTPPELL